MARFDPLTKKERSARMSLIRSKNTKPEWLVRRSLHSRGYRFRLHGQTLPGRPDLVFPSRKKVIFVHGCFWHYHVPCTQYRLPRTRVKFWITKLEGNRTRDEKAIARLKELGWDSLVVWECQMKEFDQLMNDIQHFLAS